jgi:phosphate:Na+ symporter
MLGKGRVVALGTALAGFGLIFVGIDTLQVGMGGLAEKFSLDAIDGGSIFGVLALVGIGAAMTVVMQSSSAAVATTLTALGAGAIGVHEAAALVIGQNIGTTVTATVAAIGASISAKRTAVAHILFNLGTGVIALAALPSLEAIPEAVRRLVPGDPAAVSVAAFHTAFNLVGVLVFLPLTIPFSKFVERLLPEKKSPFTFRLDKSVAQLGAVGIEAVRRTLEDVSTVLGRAGASATEPGNGRAAAGEAANKALPVLDEVRAFMEAIVVNSQDPIEYRRHVSNLHALDHLAELNRMMQVVPQVPSDFDPEARVQLRAVFDSLADWHESDPATTAIHLEELVKWLQPALKAIRHSALAKVAAGQTTQESALVTLDFIRWADQAAWHAWRVGHHLWVAGSEHAAEAPVVS